MGNRRFALAKSIASILTQKPQNTQNQQTNGTGYSVRQTGFALQNRRKYLELVEESDALFSGLTAI